MTTIETTESIWQTIPGAKPLFEVYGYWPTLHDAVVRELKVGFAERTLTLVVDYSDLVLGYKTQPNIRTRITMRWFGTTESTLRLEVAELYGINLAQRDNMIETRFDDYWFGMHGFILSAGMEVLQIKSAPEPAEPEAHTVQLLLK